ncbi:class I SAM-dependent methyltransferase [uncultured Desulfobacter sp.]|uniref:class I SAM-dependent methyltransferase n=1 Tax=uncultured Desulfobacter sp. TaxID=240139 RepID=UPI002AAB4773|nr:class I SAM-dependent methyltransferase [uncultured Desulfobacter sp.]
MDFKRLGISPGHRILDIGCGEGRHTVRACQESGTVCIGADFGFGNLVATKNKLEFHESLNDLSCRNWALSAMDITALPFEDNSFDVVICSEVLEHIPDDNKAINELVRIVRPGKILAVSVPRAWPEWICWQLSDEYYDTDMGHVRIYSKKQIIEKIEDKGTRYLGSHYAHSLHTPYWWLKCFSGPARTDSVAVNLYHKLLVWDLMKKPALTSFMDRLLNPVLGKSLVLYFRKPY